MDRKEEIYEKALELFIAEGYEETPLSRIAKALNLTKAGLYHYFKTKEELLFLFTGITLKRILYRLSRPRKKSPTLKDVSPTF